MDNLVSICATPHLDAVYVGPADLSVALGAAYFGDPAVQDRLEQALKDVTGAAAEAGIACGIHCLDGSTAARRLTEGFTFATVSSDITHLQEAAASHLAAALGTRAAARVTETDRKP